MKYKLIGMLALSHIIVDINQGVLPALIPYLLTTYHLSYTSGTSLVFAANISSSIVQPLFGYYSDKVSVPWVMPLGMFFAGFGLSLTGIVSSYWLIFILVAISGIGIAAFHPEAARLVNRVSGEKKATGVSMFTAGGSIGFAVGPVIVSVIITYLGMQGTILLIAPVSIMVLFFMTQFSKIKAINQTFANDETCTVNAPNTDEWKAFFRLLGAVICRSVIFFGFNTFLPLYWIDVLEQSKLAGSKALTILLIIGAITTIIAGRLADHYGHKYIVRIGFIALAPLLIIFVNTQSLNYATILLIPISFALFSTFSPMVVLGQKYLPNHIGLASGVTLGLAVSIGGLFSPLLGLLADRYGILMALKVVAFLPIIATIVAFTLPTPQADKVKSIKQSSISINDI